VDHGEPSCVGPRYPLALPAQLNAAAQAYLGHTSSRSPAANPLYAELGGLPPMRLLVGGRELLKDDTMPFSELACTVGVEVHVEVWEGMLLSVVQGTRAR
jgi:monoterpene epsilon-lactone hydrolase